jgi:hypothetical protein
MGIYIIDLARMTSVNVHLGSVDFNEIKRKITPEMFAGSYNGRRNKPHNEKYFWASQAGRFLNRYQTTMLNFEKNKTNNYCFKEDGIFKGRDQDLCDHYMDVYYEPVKNELKRIKKVFVCKLKLPQ